MKDVCASDDDSTKYLSEGYGCANDEEIRLERLSDGEEFE